MKSWLRLVPWIALSAVVAWFAGPFVWPAANARLMRAIERNDLAGVRRAVDDGADVDGKPDSQEHEGVSPLGAAAEFGRVEIARLLIDRGADVNLHDGWGMTALTAAAENDNETLIRL